jgi:pimeloyl-ACP methyl ester carboxylesterase
MAKTIFSALTAVALGATSTAAPAASGEDQAAKTVILVHGGFVDGSGWAGVHRILRADGYKVVVVQNPTTSLADDVAVTRRAIALAQGEVVLVGHSYGGAVISEAGSDPKVRSLVYVAAFAPDQGDRSPR